MTFLAVPSELASEVCPIRPAICPFAVFHVPLVLSHVLLVGVEGDH